MIFQRKSFVRIERARLGSISRNLCTLWCYAKLESVPTSLRLAVPERLIRKTSCKLLQINGLARDIRLA